MTASAIRSQPNGLAKSATLVLSESEFDQYASIIALRDEIFAGQHPRLKLDSQLPTKVDTVASSLNGTASGLSLPSDISASTKQTNHATYSANALHSLPGIQLAQPSRPQPTTSTPSGFDPIFLTKSADLISAETKLERERLERAFEQQMAQKKSATGKVKESEAEAIPDFDPSEALERALELVKPLAAGAITAINGNNSPGSDDNTFYSSQINDSEADEARLHPKVIATKPCRFFFEGKCDKGAKCNYSHDPAFKAKLQQEPLTADAGLADARNNNLSHRRSSPQYGTRRGSPDYGREEGEVEEESSYSPPRAQEQQIQPDAMKNKRNNQNRQNGGRNGRPHDFYPPPRETGPSQRKRSGRGSPVYDNQPPPQTDKRFSGRASPDYGGQVVRNHITSPLAPQPARVSPLAVAKMPNLGRSQQGQGDRPRKNQNKGNNAQDNSPNVGQPAKGKKRRREQDKNDNNRNVAPRRYIGSPAPYIKEEPVSPPPVNALPPPSYPARDAPRSPIVVDYPSPRGERVVYQQPPRERIYVDEPRVQRVSSPSVRRIVSGPAGHYEAEPDLRRVVSARHLNRAMSPQQEPGYYTPPSASSAPRPSSRAYVIEGSPEPRPVYRASVQPQPIHYARPAQRSPELHQEYPAPREPVMMAPPPRRIYVDNNGNQFYERPVAPERVVSVAPPTRPQYADEIDSATVRRSSVHPEIQPQQRYRYVDDIEPQNIPRTSVRPESSYQPQPRYIDEAEPQSYRTGIRPETRYPQETRYVQRLSPEPTSPRYAEPQIRYEPAPRYVDYQNAPPPPPPQRMGSRAASRAMSHAPSRVEIHHDDYARPTQRIIEIPRERPTYIDDGPPSAGMPPPQPGMRLQSVAPAYHQANTNGRYAEEYDGGRFQAVERNRVATAQPEGGRYVIGGGRSYEALPREATAMRHVSGMEGRAGSVIVEAPRDGRRIEYVQAPRGY